MLLRLSNVTCRASKTSSYDKHGYFYKPNKSNNLAKLCQLTRAALLSCENHVQPELFRKAFINHFATSSQRRHRRFQRLH